MIGTLNVETGRWIGTCSSGARCARTIPRKQGELNEPRTYLSPRAGRGRIALAIRVRGSFRELSRNDFKNTRHVAEDVIVPKSQDAIVMIGEPFVANHIARVIGMLATVYLNNETTLAADKINCVRANRLLPNELVTIEPARPQSIPQSRFGFRRNSSQASRASGFDLVSYAHVEAPPHPDCSAIRPLPASGERLAPLTIR
jgi:hypothetical protein